MFFGNRGLPGLDFQRQNRRNPFRCQPISVSGLTMIKASFQLNHRDQNTNVSLAASVSQGRNGKHKQVVTKILSDLDQLPAGIALKVPLAELAESKENVRSALNRAINKAGRNVATASDANFLYVWNESQ
jgi:hypothetical protein